jgi:hypothetical protein
LEAGVLERERSDKFNQRDKNKFNTRKEITNGNKK